MIGQADSDDGVRKPRLIWQKQADKMAITRGKMGKVSFLHKLEIRKLCLKLVSFLHKLETKINYAWNRFHFYTSLKRKQTMLEKVSMPPAWWLNSRYMPPKLQSIWKADGVKVQVTRSKKDSTGILRDLIKDSNWTGTCFIVLTRLTH